jgi:NADPH:quinone reductase-like Zn-dependent oxidoreductase
VLIEVGAVGISLSDVLMFMGGYPGMEHTLPHPLALEFAGTVSGVGAGVSKIAVGDRACGITFPPQGGASDYVLADAADVGVLPEALSLEEGAAVPVAYMTAQAALYRHANMREGDKVLVLAGASALGLASIQLANLAGAEAYGAASAGKLDAVRDIGAKDAFDYTVDGWQSDLPPMDIVLDPIGGDSFQRSYDLLAPGGKLLILDATARYPGPGETDYRTEASDPQFDPLELLKGARSVIGINMPSHWPRDGGAGRLAEEALSYFDQDGLRPPIARVFPFEEIGDAFRYVQDRRSIGRVIVSRA